MFNSQINIPLKKLIFTLKHKLLINDAIRNFSYQWLWNHIKTFPPRTTVCDIGSRDSALASFLAWRKFSVTAIDPDHHFFSWQKRNQILWKVNFSIIENDFLEYDSKAFFDIIIAIFSLQHAGEKDIDAYIKAASLLNQNGLLFIANEYDHQGTRWQRNRIDGDLRIYGPDDLQKRIIEPLSLCQMDIRDHCYAKIKNSGSTLCWTKDPDKSNFCFICAQKSDTFQR